MGTHFGPPPCWTQEPSPRAKPGRFRVLPAPSSLISWLIRKQRKPRTGLGERGYRGQGEGPGALGWGWQGRGPGCRAAGGWGNGQGGSRPPQSNPYPHSEVPHPQPFSPQSCSQPPHPQAFTCTRFSHSSSRSLTAQMPSSSSPPALPQQQSGQGHLPGLFMAPVSPGPGPSSREHVFRAGDKPRLADSARP